MRYIEEYHMGYEAGYNDEMASDNPHRWKSVEWYAWHAGYEAGHKDRLTGNYDDYTHEQAMKERNEAYARTKNR